MLGRDSDSPDSSDGPAGARNFSAGSLTQECRIEKNSSIKPSYVSCVIKGVT